MPRILKSPAFKVFSSTTRRCLPRSVPTLPRALPSRHVRAQPTHFRGFSESVKSAQPSNAFNPGDPTTWFKPTTPPPAPWSSDWSQSEGKAIHRDLVGGDGFSFCYGFNDQMVQPLAFSTKSPPNHVYLFVYKEEYYFYNYDILVRFSGRFASHEDFLSQFKGKFAILQMGVEVPMIQREIPDDC
ncbi:hypothetical protein BDZ89DRAFT_1165083 [Hymenopellis radicata]|nr:hypothetical protein BDZ89DRAFT_1165083 [Hymenopellis radicata]